VAQNAGQGVIQIKVGIRRQPAVVERQAQREWLAIVAARLATLRYGRRKGTAPTGAPPPKPRRPIC
jgi:hypothetical protein